MITLPARLEAQIVSVPSVASVPLYFMGEGTGIQPALRALGCEYSPFFNAWQVPIDKQREVLAIAFEAFPSEGLTLTFWPSRYR